MAKIPVLSKLALLLGSAPIQKAEEVPMPLLTWNPIEKQLHPYYGVVSGTYYAMTGMPWLSSDARKAVMTEWFWQPIRGQPRRVDTTELRKYSNTNWVQAIVMTILNQVCSIPWDIVPKEGKEYANVEAEIENIKQFFLSPNKNSESFNDIIRAWLKDVLEIDAGVLVKVYSIDSFDFEHLEPRSGAPLLKPLICPICNGTGKGSIKSFKEYAENCLIAMDKVEKSLPESVHFDLTEVVSDKKSIDYKILKPDFKHAKEKMVQVISENSPNDVNTITIEGIESDKTCPFCNGTGRGRQITEIYCRDGASFLLDADRTGWCFLPQTKVQTNFGFENIEEITGLVLDHGGAFRKFCPLERYYSGDVLRIKVEGTPEIVCTPEHPFLINGEWIEAKNLKLGDCVSVTTPNYDNKYFEFTLDFHARTNSVASLRRHRKSNQLENHKMVLELNKQGKNGWQIHKQTGINHRTVYSWLNQRNTPFKLNEKEKKLNEAIKNLKVDETFARFLGYYVAEGYSMSDGTIGFCFHTKEKEYYEFVSSFVDKVFNKKTRTQKFRIENGKTVYSARVDMQSVPLSNWLKENFGCNAHTKKIPAWLYYSPASVRTEFIKAYCQGDGNLDKKYLVIGTTVSEQLSLGIKSLCNSLGLKAIICEFPERFSNFSNKKVRTSKSYKVTVAGKFKEISDVFFPKKEMNYKIRKISKDKYSGIVYNLNVEETNTYNVFGISVHNCYGFWQYSYSIPAHPMWFNRDELIYFKQNPRSMSVYGYSAVQSSLELIKALEYSVKYNMSLFIDGAVPGGVVGVENMSNEELKRMKAQWENELKGQPNKTVFINKKTTFTPFAFNNRDMQFQEGQWSAWKQVIANFNMTPADLGIIQDVNRSTSTQQTEMTRRKCIRPIIKKIEEMINTQLMPELNAENVEFRYIVDDPIEERKQAELSEIYLRNGLKTINEVRIKNGEPPVDWGDEDPRKAKMNMGTRGQVTGRASEVREDRPAGLEAERRENTAQKDYQAAFQSQVPFITTIQNLSTPVPFAVPKQGHINTQYPYSEISARCPKCGFPTLETISAQAGSVTEPWYQCVRCRAHYNSDELKRAIAELEELHGQKTTAPKVTAESTNMNTAPHPELVAVAERVQEYTQTQGFQSLSPAKRKSIKTIITKLMKKKMSEDLAVEKMMNLGFDQLSAYEVIRKSMPIVIDNFSDFIRLLEQNEQRLRFNQVLRFVENVEDGVVFRYSDGKYNYECEVPREGMVPTYAQTVEEFYDKYVKTAISAKDKKRTITIEG